MSRDYYNRRVGKDGPPPRLELDDVVAQLAAAFTFVDQQGYLQRSFGYRCVDAGTVAGLKGADFRQSFYLDTGIKIAGAVTSFIETCSDDVAVFTLVEYVHDHLAKPLEGEGFFETSAVQSRRLDPAEPPSK